MASNISPTGKPLVPPTIPAKNTVEKVQVAMEKTAEGLQQRTKIVQERLEEPTTEILGQEAMGIPGVPTVAPLKETMMVKGKAVTGAAEKTKAKLEKELGEIRPKGLGGHTVTKGLSGDKLKNLFPPAG